MHQCGCVLHCSCAQNICLVLFELIGSRHGSDCTFFCVEGLKSWISPPRALRSWSQCWRSGWLRPSTGTRKASRTWWSSWEASRPKNGSDARASRLRRSRSWTPTLRRTPCQRARRSQKLHESSTTTGRWCESGSATGDRRWKTRAKLMSSRLNDGRGTFRKQQQQQNPAARIRTVSRSQTQKWLKGYEFLVLRKWRENVMKELLSSKAVCVHISVVYWS